MCFIAHALSLEGKIVELCGCPVMITSDTEKHFTYRNDGLVPEISEAVKFGLLPKIQKEVVNGVLHRTAFPRISRTSPYYFVILHNYISLWNNKRLGFSHWIACLPKILFMVTYMKIRRFIPDKFVVMGKRFLGLKN